ncbi:MAG: hypothetical protein QOH25_1961 [Acidobacteriota bacterium]|jgi:tetratricopeptide (TPR) repeat protein|nr:hypothetical protein [Acidobacteriota bacterium]
MQLANHKRVPLEQKQRLSRSILWKLQRNFYNDQGVEAWRTAGIPHHITSNPPIAEAYAKVVFGFLRDCHAARHQTEGSSFPPVDSSQPIYIIELGSGHGRFSYLFIKRFLDIYRRSVLKDIPVKYVMTDFVERNVEYWRAHPWLQPFVEEGSLDFARFDLESDQELRLVHSGALLSAETVQNPMVLIANYIFDSIPQDAFHIEDGQLYESLVTVLSTRHEPEADDPEILTRLQISYSYQTIGEDYYGDPEWNRILQNCRERLPGTAFLFPTAALKFIENFRQLSGGRGLLLSADKGFNQDEALLEGQGMPGLTMHGNGCFSMMVDYQIIGEYFRQHSGHVLHPAHRHASINISAFMFGNPPGGYIETRQAYEDAIEKFGPDDFHTLIRGIETFYGALNLEQILASLRLSGWDYQLLRRCLPILKEYLADISETQKQELYEAIQKTWDSYLPIGEEDDLAFHLGTLLLEMEFYAEALEFLQHSASLYGMEPGTAYNMGVCYHSLRQMEKALECINQALRLDPEFDAAKTLRIKLQSALGYQAVQRL